MDAPIVGRSATQIEECTMRPDAHAPNDAPHPQEMTLENAPQHSIDLEYMTFSSYTRLCVVISVFIGLIASILFFVADVLGVDTAFRWGPISVADTEAGVVALFIGPFFFGVVGLPVSPLTYRLFIWALRNFWGLPLTGSWKEIR